MDSEEKFKKATNDKISTSLFAGDKFYNFKKKQTKRGLKSKWQIKIWNLH
jgi:hypothetical protein